MLLVVTVKKKLGNLCYGVVFEGRLCCDFSTVFEFSTVFLSVGAFGAGNHALYLISMSINCVIPGAEGAYA